MTDARPRVFVCGSAVGFYGNRGDEILTEESEGGDGFLAGVVREWEAAARSVSDAGIRVVSIRTPRLARARGMAGVSSTYRCRKAGEYEIPRESRSLSNPSGVLR